MYALKVERAWVEVLPDEHADSSYLYQEDLGFEERREAYERGDFGFVGVRACARVIFETEQRGWINGPVVSSPGLWGIEDDSGNEYIEEIAKEQADELVPMLEALGLSRRKALAAKREAVGGGVRYR